MLSSQALSFSDAEKYATIVPITQTNYVPVAFLE